MSSEETKDVIASTEPEAICSTEASGLSQMGLLEAEVVARLDTAIRAAVSIDAIAEPAIESTDAVDVATEPAAQPEPVAEPATPIDATAETPPDVPDPAAGIPACPECGLPAPHGACITAVKDGNPCDPSRVDEYELSVLYTCSRTGKTRAITIPQITAVAMARGYFSIDCLCGCKTNRVMKPKPKADRGIPKVMNRHQRRSLEAQGLKRTKGGLYLP